MLRRVRASAWHTVNRMVMKMPCLVACYSCQAVANIPEGKGYPVLCTKLDCGGNGWMKNVVDYMVKGSFKEDIMLDWNEVAEIYDTCLPNLLKINQIKSLQEVRETTWEVLETLYRAHATSLGFALWKSKQRYHMLN